MQGQVTRSRRWLRAIALLALMLGACGDVTERGELAADAGAAVDTGAGAGDAAPADGPASDQPPENPTDAGAVDGTPAPACLSRDVEGFALNAPCAPAGACYGGCKLAGAPFVGCVAGFDAGVTCAPSCSACP